jgi:hypothetical protein
MSMRCRPSSQHIAPPPIHIAGLPDDLPADTMAVFRSRMHTAVGELMAAASLPRVRVAVEGGEVPAEATPTPGAAATVNVTDESSRSQRARQFQSTTPRFDFGALVLPPATREQLLSAAETLAVRNRVFGDWGLSAIEPNPSSAINFYGEPGTGKTLAAHSVASHLGSRILIAKASHLESKFHGEGSKNLDALFAAARRDDAVLFIDEADSLLSRRFASPTQGSEQAVNAMRSELLMCLDEHQGIVIFATNLVSSYDRAFESRARHILFPAPDEAARREIWRLHLVTQLPLSDGVSIEQLAQIPGVTGRDIKNAVVTAAVDAARRGADKIEHDDLARALVDLCAMAPARAETVGQKSPSTDEVARAVKRAVDAGDVTVSDGVFPSAARSASS